MNAREIFEISPRKMKYYDKKLIFLVPGDPDQILPIKTTIQVKKKLKKVKIACPDLLCFNNSLSCWRHICSYSGYFVLFEAESGGIYSNFPAFYIYCNQNQSAVNSHECKPFQE